MEGVTPYHLDSSPPGISFFYLHDPNSHQIPLSLPAKHHPSLIITHTVLQLLSYLYPSLFSQTSSKNNLYSMQVVCLRAVLNGSFLIMLLYN